MSSKQQPIGGDPYYAQLERENTEMRRELDSMRRELQRERERYDALLAAINPAHPQTQSPYASAMNPINQAPQPQPLVHPVPPPQQSIQQKWGNEIKPDWY